MLQRFLLIYASVVSAKVFREAAHPYAMNSHKTVPG